MMKALFILLATITVVNSNCFSEVKQIGVNTAVLQSDLQLITTDTSSKYGATMTKYHRLQKLNICFEKSTYNYKGSLINI